MKLSKFIARLVDLVSVVGLDAEVVFPSGNPDGISHEPAAAEVSHMHKINGNEYVSIFDDKDAEIVQVVSIW